MTRLVDWLDRRLTVLCAAGLAGAVVFWFAALAVVVTGP